MTDQPLRGVRIIEFCQIASGPFAGLLLADMGRVIWHSVLFMPGDSARPVPR